MKTKKVFKSEEQIKQERLESDLKDCREHHINEPTRFFKIGEKVSYGAITETTILESIDDGKIYKIHNKHIQIKNGKEEISENDTYQIWHNLFPRFNLSTDRLTIEDIYNIQFSQRDINGLLHMYYFFGIDLEPEYQRGLVWELEDKVKLIDSIFNRIDIGKFAVIRRDYGFDGPLYEMLDGKQRLTALIDFYEDRFKYKNKLFSELHWRDKGHFENYVISLGETHDLTEEQKLAYFLRLNTTGKPQDPKHIEKITKLLNKKLDKD